MLAALTQDEIAGLIRRCNIGYDLDCGGHSFELAGAGFPASALKWEYPDNDYFPCAEGLYETCRRETTFVVFLPFAERGSSEFKSLPREIPDLDWEGKWVLSAEGELYTTDHDCTCWGKPDPDVPGDWEFTGNCGDQAYPACHRCEGEGSVESPGGAWALYVFERDSED